MIKLTLSPDQSCPAMIRIGVQEDNLAEVVQFDLTDWVTKYGAGVPQLRVKRAGDTEPYPVLMDFTGGIATWTITDVDTSVAGYGSVQLSYTVGEVVKHTEIIRMFCGSSLTGSADPPDPYEDWLSELQGLAAETVLNAEAAEDSAEAAALSEANASASEDAAALSEQHAAASEDNAYDYMTRAETAAENAEQAAAQSGYILFDIDPSDGCLYMERVNSPVTFELDGGYLYVEEVS